MVHALLRLSTLEDPSLRVHVCELVPRLKRPPVHITEKWSEPAPGEDLELDQALLGAALPLRRAVWQFLRTLNRAAVRPSHSARGRYASENSTRQPAHVCSAAQISRQKQPCPSAGEQVKS